MQVCRTPAQKPRTRTRTAETAFYMVFFPRPVQPLSDLKDNWCPTVPPRIQLRDRFVRGRGRGCCATPCGRVIEPCKYMSGHGRQHETLWGHDAISVNPQGHSVWAEHACSSGSPPHGGVIASVDVLMNLAFLLRWNLGKAVALAGSNVHMYIDLL